MARPGDALLRGRYRVMRLLHRGGFGFIYLAWDKILGREVALKELIPVLADDPAMLNRFMCEAQATSRLAHPNIARTLNVFNDQDDYYIAMEYLPGGSLEELLQDQERLSLDEAVMIISDVCAGLAEAHSRGVCHCDIKPGNILFDENGVAKLADFGIAHVSDSSLAHREHTAGVLSAGTLHYMAPEQLDGVRDDPRVDVYALGVVLYQMLSGRPYLKFQTQDAPEAQADNMSFIRHRRPRPLADQPSEVNVVLMKALAKSPAKRYESAEALRSALIKASLPYLTSMHAVMSLSPLDAAAFRPLELMARHAPAPDWTWAAAAATGASLLLLLAACVFLGRVGGW